MSQIDKWILPLAALLWMGCANQKAAFPERPPAPATPAIAARPASVPPEVAENGCSADADCRSNQICTRSRCTDVTSSLAECGTVRLHFPFNSAILGTSEGEALDRSARCLSANRSLRITIAGHADERGTVEYNLALGQQRAAAVAQYLQFLGVDPEQLGTVSYGKERPLCMEQDEGCWSRNRRATVPPPDLAKR